MTEPGIELDPERGVNPHLTTCCRCGGESQELIMLGCNDYIWQCPCGQNIVGGKRSSKMKCPKCGQPSLSHKFVRRFEEHERLPSMEPCDSCKKEIAEHRALVEAGGVYFKCMGCGTEGVIEPENTACQEVRKELGVPAPGLCGVKTPSCPFCTNETPSE
jgi:predicted RNA-binding Zn-ribbon protein involved in translation (DUF1610 family)